MTCKIIFELERDEDGFPPISVEMLNATSLGDGRFRLQNAPFFAENISYNDIVKATPTGVSGQFRFEEVIEPSEFASISIIILDSSMDEFLMELIRGFDCVVEYGEFGVYRVLAVAIPDATNYALLREKLRLLEDGEQVSVAELALPDKSVEP